MSEAPKYILAFLGIATAVILFFLVVSQVFNLYKKASNIADAGGKKMDNMTILMDESDYTKYDGVQVKGADVIAAVKYFQDGEPICINVQTATGNAIFCYTDESLTTKSEESIANCQRKGAANYINPNAKYIGKVERNETDNTIWGITFTFDTTS